VENDQPSSNAYLSDLFGIGFTGAARELWSVADRDWSSPARGLDWSCWRTVDHITDCIFSYTLQLAGRARDGWLHLEELRAKPDATPGQLLDSLTAVANLFQAVLQATPIDAVASDGVFELGVADWTARALNELLLHTHDVLGGLGGGFAPSPEVCSFVLGSPTLWMYDGVQRKDVPDAWTTMLAASGRASGS
jgi:hypothetical protein